MSIELEQQIRQLAEALDRHAPPVAEDELWHRQDADGPDGAPVTLLDLHRDPPAGRRRGWTLAVAVGLVAGLIGVVALATRPDEPVRSNAPAPTSAVPPPSTTGAVETTTTAPANLPPTPAPDVATMQAGMSSLILDVVANDSDPEHNMLTLTGAELLASSPGEAEVAVEGTQVRFTLADPCVVGEYEFRYDVSDSGPGAPTASATVTVNVVPGSAAPSPIADSLVVASNLPIEIPLSTLLANDGTPGVCAQVVEVVGSDIAKVTLVDDAVLVERAPASSGDVLVFSYTVSSFSVRASATVTVSLI